MIGGTSLVKRPAVKISRLTELPKNCDAQQNTDDIFRQQQINADGEKTADKKSERRFPSVFQPFFKRKGD